MLNVLQGISPGMGFRISIAHFNHRLRGPESEKDEAFVRDLASRMSLPFVSGRGDVRAWMKGHGGSREEVARLLRYRFFQEQSRELSADKVALAHHAGDQAETVLMRLLRGAGSGGLAGIAPIRDERFVRPLLFVTRKEIEAYLHENKMAYRRDASNLEMDCLRNRVRMELIPFLRKKYNPAISLSLVRLAEIMREEDNFFRDYTNDLLDACLMDEREKKLTLRRSSLMALHPAIRRRLIRRVVEKVQGDTRGLALVHTEDLMDLLQAGKAGKRLHWPGGLRVMLSYNAITLARGDEGTRPKDEGGLISVPGELTFRGKRIVLEVLDAGKWKPGKEGGKTVAWLDRSKVSPPLLVRNRRHGDRFQPLGMQRGKKLKNYFIDRKVPLEDRDNIPLLVSDERIIWIGGLDISELAKMDTGTREGIRITMTGE